MQAEAAAGEGALPVATSMARAEMRNRWEQGLSPQLQSPPEFRTSPAPSQASEYCGSEPLGYRSNLWQWPRRNFWPGRSDTIGIASGILQDGSFVLTQRIESDDRQNHNRGCDKQRLPVKYGLWVTVLHGLPSFLHNIQLPA